MWKFRPDAIYRSSIFSKPKFVARFVKVTAFYILIIAAALLLYPPASLAEIWPGDKSYLGLFALFYLFSYIYFLFARERYTYKISFNGRAVKYSWGYEGGMIPLKTITRVEVEEVQGWNGRFWPPFAPAVVTEGDALCYVASSGPAIKIFSTEGIFLVSCKDPATLKAAIDECRREREAWPEAENKTARTERAVEEKSKSPISRPGV